MGKAIITGANIYEAAPRKEICDLLGSAAPSGMVYSPATGFIVAPFSALPYNNARHARFLTLNLAVPWGLMLSQVSPLALGLLYFFFVALYSNRPRLAVAIADLATTFKMTLADPFLGLLLLRWRILEESLEVPGHC